MRTASFWLILVVGTVALATAQKIPDKTAIDAEVYKIMSKTHAKGMAIAVIDRGKVEYVHAYGARNTKGAALTTDTVMYGASLTKAVFAYTVMQLVDQGKLKLDTPIQEILEQPLASYDDGSDPKFAEKYGPYKTLAADPRWKKITPRMCLTYSTGLNNFWFSELDKKFHIHFEPGCRYSYSGDGLVLLQFTIEHGRKAQGLGVSVGDLTKANFDRLRMKHTSLIWRDDFASNLADGWDDHGNPEEHDQRSKVRASGSMDTTISDLAKFTVALVRGDGLSVSSRRELTTPQLHVTTAHQFPLFLLPDLPANDQRKDLNAGLGVVLFDGPHGHGFYKGGHNEITANTLVCIEDSQRCVLILSNDGRAEAGYAELMRFLLGDTGVPYDWEYGDRAGKS